MEGESFLIALVSGVAAGLVSWGTLRAQVHALRDDIGIVRADIDTVRKAVSAAHVRIDQMMVLIIDRNAAHARRFGRDDDTPS